MSKDRKIADRSRQAFAPGVGLSEQLIQILGENRFYTLMAMGTVAELDQVLLDTTRRYATAADAVARVMGSYDTLSGRDRQHIEELRAEYEGASLLAMRMSYQRLLGQLEEALTLKGPRQQQHGLSAMTREFLDGVTQGFTLQLFARDRKVLRDPGEGRNG